ALVIRRHDGGVQITNGLAEGFWRLRICPCTKERSKHDVERFLSTSEKTRHPVLSGRKLMLHCIILRFMREKSLARSHLSTYARVKSAHSIIKTCRILRARSNRALADLGLFIVVRVAQIKTGKMRGVSHMDRNLMIAS